MVLPRSLGYKQVNPSNRRSQLKLRERLKKLIEELDRLHPDGFFNGQAWNMEESLPDFIVTTSGQERHFTKKAREELYAIAAIIHENDSSISAVVELKDFGKLVRKCVANLHADGKLTLSDLQESQIQLNEAARASLQELRTEFTHYFPASTLGMELEKPFVLGPVTFMTRDQWIDSVDFSDELKRRYLEKQDVNADWKNFLRNALSSQSRDENPEGLAGDIYSAIRRHPSVLKITIQGFEYNLSRKVGEIVCKTALDSISLLFGGREYFHQIVLADERLEPIERHQIVEIEGNLSLSGRSLGPRVRNISPQRASAYLAEHPDVLQAIGHILNALVVPGSSKHPNLAKRWATALDWMAEGQRDKNDAVALAKIASSLDVLACGGKFAGILEMVTNLTGVQPDDIVIKGLKPRSLKTVIKEIYDDGRSQILHGTHFDRLKSFEALKSHAAFFARISLIMGALRLEKFTGPDGDKEFRTIPA